MSVTETDSQPKEATSRVDMRGPVAAVVVVSLFILYTLSSEPAKPGAFLPWTLNPTGLLNQTQAYVLLYVLTVPAKEIMNHVLQWLCFSFLGFKRMDEGDSKDIKVRKLEVLETIDLCYLALNTVVEYLGMNHIAATLIDGPLEKSLSSLSVLNGPLAFLICMLLNDLIYYPFHLVAHRREFYAYCHKQHHRQFVPFRGYADAANQHPIEQCYGFSIFILSLHLTARLLGGIHASAAWCATLSWAILNIANHLAFDSWIHLPLPYPAYPRDHQMHHRFPQCNYSTLTSLFDRLGGTFRQYRIFGQPIGKTGAQEITTRDITGRPEAVPSPWSFVALAVGTVVAGVIVEVIQTGGLPTLSALQSFSGSLLFLGTLAAGCAAATGTRVKSH